MFTGHFAPALIAATHPRAPHLGTLFVAAQLVDIGFATLVLTGGEAMRIMPGITAMNPLDLYHMPYTHSLLGSVVWALGFGALIWALTKNRTAALLVAAVVVSHWFTDWLVHRPDLTLLGAPPKLGLGLWDHPWIAMPMEVAFIGGALYYYARRTTGPFPRRIWILAGVLALFQAINWFGPQETVMSAAVPLTMLAAYALLCGVAAWAGRGRRALA